MKTTPTEARELAERAEKYGQSPLGFRKTPHEYALLNSAKALRSLADQVEALEKVAYAAKRSVMNPAWSGVCDEDIELEQALIVAGLLNRAREAT